jgi:hypothetical protein
MPPGEAKSAALLVATALGLAAADALDDERHNEAVREHR